MFDKGRHLLPQIWKIAQAELRRRNAWRQYCTSRLIKACLVIPPSNCARPAGLVHTSGVNKAVNDGRTIRLSIRYAYYH